MHWREQRLQTSEDDRGRKVPRYTHYLFSKTGTILGYAKNTIAGYWQGYFGRTGKLMGVYDTLAEAKEAIITKAKQGGNK